MASGWNLWVWLVGVVVRRYIIDILMFFVLVYVIFVQYSKRCSKNIRDR